MMMCKSFSEAMRWRHNLFIDTLRNPKGIIESSRQKPIFPYVELLRPNIACCAKQFGFFNTVFEQERFGKGQ